MPEFTLEVGGMRPSAEPGIGVQVDRSRVSELAARSAFFGLLNDPVAARFS